MLGDEPLIQALGSGFQLNPYSLQYGREILKPADALSDEASTATASSELAALDLKYKRLEELCKTQSGEIETLQQKLAETTATIERLNEQARASTKMPNEDEGLAPAEPEVVSTAAARQRLRRICEKKADGTCQVPAEVFSQWSAGGSSREKLLKVFIANGLDKQAFLREVTHEMRKSKEMRLAITGDFLTEEEMKADGTPQYLDPDFINVCFFKYANLTV